MRPERPPAGLGVTLIMSCFFCTAGVVMPFLPQWLATERGLAGAQIGLVVSSAQLARIAIGPLIAAWADGFADRRTPLRLLSGGAFVSYALFFNSDHLVLLLILGFCGLALTAAVTPLVEGAALRSARDGGLSFGTSRAIGSSAFILGSVASGTLVSMFGVGLAPVYILTALGGAVATAMLVLRPDPAPPSNSGFRGRLKQAWPLLKNKKFALALLATGLVQSAHGFFYAFSTLVWTRQGFDAGTIGALWATGVACEVLFLLMLRRTEKALSAETMVLIGAGASVLRWGAMAFAPPLFVVLPIQILHAATFAATHVGALRIIERETPPEVAGLGMTLYAVLSAGTPLGLITIMSGVLYDRVGAFGYMAMAVLAAAGFVAAIFMTRAASEYSPLKRTS